MWTFIQDQILGMKWLNDLIEQLLLMVGLNLDSRIGGSIQFFIFVDKPCFCTLACLE